MKIEFKTHGRKWGSFEVKLSTAKHGRIVFNQAVLDGILIKGDFEMVLLPAGKKLPVAIRPTDAKGHTAQVDGVPVWASSDSAIVSVTPAEDGLSAVLRPGVNLGTAQITVSADADLGAGIVTISGMLEVEAVAGQAVALGIIAGSLEDDV